MIRVTQVRRTALQAAACLGAAALLTGTVGVLMAGPASASYISQGLASAVGIRVTITSDSVPIFSTPVDASMPLADVAVDARGNSLAQAAYPYPGDTISQGVPGLIATEGLMPPTVPANETSQYPTTPSSHLDAMAYQLLADSAQYTSTATAQVGANGTPAGSAVTNGADAAVTVNPATGEVDASAVSTTAPLTLGVLNIGAITSHVTLKRLPGAAPTRDVGIDIGKITVAGMSVGLGAGGLTLPAAGTIPIPNEAAMINSALSSAGLTLTYISEIDTADGSVAPGVELQQSSTSNGQVTKTTYIIGQASASTTTTGRAAVTAKPTTKAPSPTAHASTAGTPTKAASPTPAKRTTTPAKVTSAPARPTPVAPVVATTAAPSLPVATTPSSTGAVLPIVPTTTGAGGALTAPPESAPSVSLAAAESPDAAGTAPADNAPAQDVQPQTTAPDSSLAAARRAPDGFGASASSFYLVLVAGGIVLLASSSTVRALGVRLLWTR